MKASKRESWVINSAAMSTTLWYKHGLLIEILRENLNSLFYKAWDKSQIFSNPTPKRLSNHTLIIILIIIIIMEWRKLHNVELHALYSSPNKIRSLKSRRLRWAEHVACMEQSRNAYRVLVGNPEGKRCLERPRCRWEDIKMDLWKVGCDPGDWIDLAEDRDQW